MKKISALLLGLLFCAAALGAEHLRIKVGGEVNHYNQIRIVNKTDYSKFNCEVFSLAEVDGKMYVRESLGKFSLNGYNDQDTCTFLTNVAKGSYIGVELPENMKGVTYSASYDDGLLIDTIELVLIKGTTPKNDDQSSLGREF